MAVVCSRKKRLSRVGFRSDTASSLLNDGTEYIFYGEESFTWNVITENVSLFSLFNPFSGIDESLLTASA